MDKIKKVLQVFAIIALVASFAIALPPMMRAQIEFIRKRAEKEAERKAEIEAKRARAKDKEVLILPLARNSGSLKIGHEFSSAYHDPYRDDLVIKYDERFSSKERGAEVFDSLVIEICKHHCDSVTDYKFTHERRRELKCSNDSASVTLFYFGGKEPKEFGRVRIEYKVPSRL